MIYTQHPESLNVEVTLFGCFTIHTLSNWHDLLISPGAKSIIRKQGIGSCPRPFTGAGNIMGGFGGEGEVRSESEGEFWGHR